MTSKNQKIATGTLLGATALAIIFGAQPTMAQNCELVNGVLPNGCTRADANTVVRIPVGKNTEILRSGRRPDQGFTILVDGIPQSGDLGLVGTLRRQDIALEAADIQVRFDGLGTTPRLDLVTAGPRQFYRAGDLVTFESQTNYPHWLQRGEVRIIDLGASGGARTVAIVPIKPNGQTQIALPEGEDLIAVHRVYDRSGRYDETFGLNLSSRSLNGGNNQDDVLTDPPEEGTDRTARRRIPVRGGSITVSSNQLSPGATIQTLGETVRADAQGNFVINRILPAGMHAVSVDVATGGQNLHLIRDVEIPSSEWFYVATADLTFGINRNKTSDVSANYDSGRLGFYAKGTTQGGYTITASADTGEEGIDSLFTTLNERDPRSMLLRIDPDDLYPTYGDDSTLLENAPTSGKFYLKVERNQNFFLWGNYRAQVNGSHFLRNERTLYGAQAEWASPAQTSQGEARVAVSLYAAQPDNLPGRDVFQGTGGSIYFLSQQDISLGSETLSIEVRDSTTGRVINRRQLSYGQDYTINHVQGVITLSQPLNSAGGNGVVITNPGGQFEYHLVAQYEFTPDSGSADGLAYGGRVETWVTDNVRVGLTGMAEETGAANQTAIGADVLYRFSEGTNATLEFAKSDGPGFGTTFSTDGGLLVNNQAVAVGNGQALRFEGHADLNELGLTTPGQVNVYYEDRTEGFSTLDYQITAATGDERLWGLETQFQTSENLEWKLNYDDYTNGVGEIKREGGIELAFQASDRVKYSLGLEYVDRNTGTEIGDRIDAALRVDVEANERLSWNLFGQATVAANGLGRNDRLGAGVAYQFGNGWSVEGELSHGTLGAGGKALLAYADGVDRSLYFGYEVTPNRELAGVTLDGNDQGRFVMGGRQRVSDNVVYYGENSYDLFGSHKSLISAYGVEYTPTDALTYSAALEVGSINDSVNGDFDRQAISLGMNYQTESWTTRGRIELRRERGLLAASNRDTNGLLASFNGRYKIDDDRRVVFSLEAAQTEGLSGTAESGILGDAQIGYAFRPVDNDRLNMLVKYRGLYDLYGQTIDGVSGARTRQKSNVFSIDAEYDLSEQWSLGGKLGFRLGQTSPDALTPFTPNNAGLAIINARYHLVHNWDILIEGRTFAAEQAQTTESGLLMGVYRQMGNNAKVGLIYNFTSFSDDLTNLSTNNDGLSINFVSKF